MLNHCYTLMNIIHIFKLITIFIIFIFYYLLFLMFVNGFFFHTINKKLFSTEVNLSDAIIDNISKWII